MYMGFEAGVSELARSPGLGLGIEAAEIAVANFEQQQPVLEFDENRSLPNNYLMDHFGMSNEEGAVTLNYGKWSGTWAEMLADPACPMGEKAREIHLKEGTDGVQRFVEGLKMAGAETKLEVKPKTEIDYALAGVQTPDAKKKVLLKALSLLYLM